MSKVSEALEVQAAAIRALQACEGQPRARAAIDRHLADLLKLLAPRIRHFIRAYRLLDHQEDAEQACAIGVIRALQDHDPDRGRFTTLVNWLLRGELQSLRFRLRLDSRGSAVRSGARTVSIEDLRQAGVDPVSHLEDEEALARTEALAAHILAQRACGTLLDSHFAAMLARSAYSNDAGFLQRMARDRAIAEAWLIGDGGPSAGLTTEQCRQIARRTIRALASTAVGNPIFDPDATRH